MSGRRMQGNSGKISHFGTQMYFVSEFLMTSQFSVQQHLQSHVAMASNLNYLKADIQSCDLRNYAGQVSTYS